MSLATRCTGCGTVFRVVQDQLRVSGGWVRCGRCSQVFNAVESLVDLELDRPAEGAAPSVHGDRIMQDLARVAGVPAAPPEDAAPAPHDTAPGAGLIVSDGALWSPAAGEPETNEPPDTEARPPEQSESGPAEAAPPGNPPDGRFEPVWDGDDAQGDAWTAKVVAAAASDGLVDQDRVAGESGLPPPQSPDDELPPAYEADLIGDARFGESDPESGDDTRAPEAAGAGPADVVDDEADEARDSPADDGREDWARLATGAAASRAATEGGRRRHRADEAPPAPSFLRDAERAARWRRPGVRASLAAVALLLASLLTLQVTLAQHDLIAARWPALQPAVQALCDRTGCVLEPPRRIESLAVESSGLVRANAAGSFRLSVLLRNREMLPLMPPSLDLNLTDAQGRLIARRVVTPAELGLAGRTVPPGAELPLQALLRSRDPGVVGYTIEIFYP